MTEIYLLTVLRLSVQDASVTGTGFFCGHSVPPVRILIRAMCGAGATLKPTSFLTFSHLFGLSLPEYLVISCHVWG